MIVVLAAKLDDCSASTAMKLKSLSGQPLSAVKTPDPHFAANVLFNAELFLNDHTERAAQLRALIAALDAADISPLLWEKVDYDDEHQDAEPSELSYILNVLDNAEGDFE